MKDESKFIRNLDCLSSVRVWIILYPNRKE